MKSQLLRIVSFVYIKNINTLFDSKDTRAISPHIKTGFMVIHACILSVFSVQITQ